MTSSSSDLGLSPTARRRRRVRALLLGSVFALGLGAGALGGTSLISSANAELASVPAATVAPVLSFADVVEAVSPAVVSVRTETAAPAQVGFGPGFERLPEGSPMERFFRQFGGGDERGQMQPFERGEPRERGQRPGGKGGRPDGAEGQEFGAAPQQGPNGLDRTPGHRAPGQRAPHGPLVEGQGSGFFISDDGYIVTNHHVIDGATSVTVVLADGRELAAEIIGSDERTDLALLKVEGDGFTHVAFAEGAPRIGDWAIAIGNPFGLGGTVTAGIVSAMNRDIGSGPYDDFIQIDAAVNRGNSGGPTFDLSGHVIGVNTAIYSPSGGNVGIAFAVPASIVQDVIQQLRDHGEIQRGWLGVQIQGVDENIAAAAGLDAARGALVVAPQPDSPATLAGIQRGDVIVAVNGEAIATPRELSRMIARLDPGAEVAVTVIREGAEQVISVTLGQLPNSRA
ncbi:MAG: trypsin-like peptidase domain-containing protein [Hyphomicrobiaceae bacterium]|nr:trypsin-like peptidase domain-containing protein [Hyphomicrobiaceae bacterium]